MAADPHRPLTLHQRRVLEEWESGDKPRLRQIAVKFGSSESAIGKTLRLARLRAYGQALARGDKKIKIRPLSLSFCAV